MNKIRCLVVDDEELARTLLENYISKIPQLELIAKCKNPLEALAILQEEDIDLIFLDIQMPELTSVEFLKTLIKKPLVIFTTAYAEYAIESYTLDIVDYLLKPFSLERFIQGVHKATERLSFKEQKTEVKLEKAKDYILVKSEHKVYKIKFSDISHIQSMREYVAYHTPDG